MSDTQVEQPLDQQQLTSDNNNNNIEVNKLTKPVIERKVLGIYIYMTLVTFANFTWSLKSKCVLLNPIFLFSSKQSQRNSEMV